MIPKSILENQILEARRLIVSDGYPISIGELTNMYKDGELQIRPAFQRFFRWNDHQKSSLIESILLGIPIPSIFVAQAENGKWELIDGLQRVSTILELQGELFGRDSNKLPQLVLQATRYLPALEGKIWSGTKDTGLSEAQCLDIKRAKIDVKIIKRESSQATKYDLFQRLNNYGTHLSGQELRSALLAAVSLDFLAWIEQLASYPSFIKAVNLGDRLMDERYDLELVLKFLILHNLKDDDLTLTKLRDFSNFLDNKSVELAEKYEKGNPALELRFKQTFDYISEHGGEEVFKKYDINKMEFQGAFLTTSYEVFALGIGFAIAKKKALKRDLLKVVKKFWKDPEMAGGYSTGKSTEARLVKFVPIGRRIV